MNFFSRIISQIKGRLSLILSKAEAQNPEVLLQNAKDQLYQVRAKVAASRRDAATLSATLKRQIEEGEKKTKNLEERALAAHAAGDMATAEELAVLLAEESATLADNKIEFDAAEANYKNFIEMSAAMEKEAKNKIRKFSDKISKARAKETQAELAEMLSSSITDVGGVTNHMERLEEVVNEKLDRADGRIRAATDSPQFADVKLKIKEQDNTKKAALANLLASRGVKPAVSQATPATPSQATPAQPVVEAPKTPTLE